MRILFQRLQVVLVCTSVVVLLSGCNSAISLTNVVEFSNAIDKAAAALGRYYQSVNDLARQKYFDELRFKTDKQMGATDVVEWDENDQKLTYNTGLIFYYNPNDIQLRVQVLTLLGKYVQGLAALASSDAPQQAEGAIQGISADMSGISTNASALIGNDNSKSAQDYGVPITQITSMCVKSWLEHKRERSLTDSITQNADNIDKLFKNLERDTSLLSQTYANNANGSLLVWVNYYNNYETSKNENKELPLDSSRQQILQGAYSAASKIALIGAADPKILIQTMHRAHKDLVEYSKNRNYPKKERELQLLAELRLFTAQVQKFSDAVDQIVAVSKQNP